jgi:hypothetical protein
MLRAARIMGALESVYGWMEARAILSNRRLSTMGRFTSTVSSKPAKMSSRRSKARKSMGPTYTGSAGGG